MIVLPIYLQIVFEYNALQAGLSIAPLSLTMFAVAALAGKRAGRYRPVTLIRWGFALLSLGLIVLLPIVPRADSGWWLLVPLIISGAGLGFLVSQLNNYTLSPISDERVSEAAGVNSAAGSFGLSFGLAFAGAILLAALAPIFSEPWRRRARSSPRRISSRSCRRSNTTPRWSAIRNSRSSWPTQPQAVADEVIRINTEARPIALQIALLVPLVAGLIGFGITFRMSRLPEIAIKETVAL